MLDTNMVSYLVKAKSPAARARMLSLRTGELACISAVTEAELLYGASKSELGAERRRLLDWVLLLMEIRPWDRRAAMVYGPLRARQEAKGMVLGPLDMLIAAHAIALGAVLVTNDQAFNQVADLPALENWATDL